MSIATKHVAFFRREWAKRFVETADITRVADSTDRGSIDDSTLQYDGSPTTVYSDRPCLVRPTTRRYTPVEFGEEVKTLVDYEIIAAWDTTGLKPDDTITIKTSEKDPELVGKTFRVADAGVDSYRTKTVIRVERDLGGGQEV